MIGRPLAENSDRPEFPRPRHLSHEIASYVRDFVMSGRLRANEQLSIDQIARDLQLSATPVREALFALRGEGFVEFEPRKGFRIAPLSRGDIRDLFLVQSDIAGELAARAATHLTKEHLQELEGIQQEMKRAAAQDDLDTVEGLNFDFHRQINRAAHSAKLSWLLSIVVNYVPRRFYSTIAGWPAASIRDHDAIMAGLMKKSPKLAKAGMSAHINHAGELLITHLEESGFWSAEDTSNADGTNR